MDRTLQDRMKNEYAPPSDIIDTSNTDHPRLLFQLLPQNIALNVKKSEKCVKY